MFEGKYSKKLTIILITTIIVVLGVLAFFVVSFVRSSSDRDDALDAAGRFEGSVSRKENKENKANGDDEQVIALNIQSENIEWGSGSGSSNAANTYKGFEVAGTIEIPKTNLKIPVLVKASAKAIDVSVAISYGPGLNKVGNTVIIGHNYKDSRFFADNKNLANGDKVYITDNTGTKVEYTIYNIYTTSPEDSDFMNRSTDGKREITLNTCTDDTKSRLIIWAKEN